MFRTTSSAAGKIFNWREKGVFCKNQWVMLLARLRHWIQRDKSDNTEYTIVWDLEEREKRKKKKNQNLVLGVWFIIIPFEEMRGKGNIMAMNRANDNLFAGHVEFEVSKH